MVKSVVAHMCAFGLKSKDENGEGLVKKATRFLSNSMALLAELDQQCPGCARHVNLMAGRAAKAAIYPRALCKAVCRGICTHMELDYYDLITVPVADGPKDLDIGAIWEQDQATDPWQRQYWDDVSGKVLNEELVKAARAEEIMEAEQMGV